MNEQSVFIAALEREDPAERAAYLDSVCGDDREFRYRMERLLRLHQHTASLLDQPGAGLAATIDLPPTVERPGTQIGPYQLVQEIGEGGMGVVYLAAQEEPVRRKVALKIIKPGMDSREVIARFAAEEQALAMMDHPNIAKVFDAGTTETGRPYFVMELVNGVPLTEYCDDNNLTTRQRLELFVLICHAVQHAHQKGIIHRDIKPSNILVTLHDGVPVPKIIDFGIAKAINQQLIANTVYTGHGQMIGTPLYMSPEQAEHSGLDIDTRSDIYSLGVMLYELLTGSTPFDREQLKDAGLDEVRRLIREQEPPRPSTRISTMGMAATTVSEHRRTDPVELSNSLRHELDWIVMKALEKDRTRRYESANDFARDIQRYLDDEPVEACPPSTIYRLKKFTRRNRTVVLATVAVGLALILGAGVATGQAIRATKAEKVAEEQLQIATEQQRLAKQQAQLAQKQKRLAEEAAEREGQLRLEAEQQRDLAQKATKEAEVARKQAEAVTSFLVEAFRSPDPERDGGTITVAELLKSARVRLEREFQDDLPLQAQLLDAFGKTYLGLGLPAEAVELLKKALDAHRKVLGTDNRETLETILNLGHAHIEAGRGEDALQLGKEMLGHAETACGGEDLLTLAARDLVAHSLLQLGQHEKAIRLFEELHSLQQRLRGAEAGQTLEVANSLAEAYGCANRLDDSFRLHQQVLDASLRTLGRDDPHTFVYMRELGSLYSRHQRYDDAIPLLQDALEIGRKINGPDHPATLHAMNLLTATYRSAGRLDEGLELMRRQWQVKEDRLALDHNATFGPEWDLALANTDAGRYEEAVQARESLLQATERQYGPFCDRTLSLLGGMARVYSEAGHNKKARELWEEVLRRLKDAPEGAFSEFWIKAQSAWALSGLNRHVEAVKAVTEMLTIVRRQEALHWVHLSDAAAIHLRAGRNAEATALVEQALSLARQQYGADHYDANSLIGDLCLCYWSQGRYAETIPLLEQSRLWMRTNLGATHYQTLLTMTLLAHAYAIVGRYEDALPLHKTTLDLMQEKLGSEAVATICAMNVYVEALRKAGQHDEALHVAEELWQITQKASDPDGFHALFNQRVLGALYCDAGRFDQGIKPLEEVLQKHRQLDGPQHPETLQSSDYLAAAYAQAGQVEKAVSLLEETMQGRRDSQGAEHPRTLESMILLGSLYLQQNQYEKAEPLLRDACDGFTKRREAAATPYDTQQCRKALEQLVQLYEKSNQPEKATAWKEKLEAMSAEPKKETK